MAQGIARVGTRAACGPPDASRCLLSLLGVSHSGNSLLCPAVSSFIQLLGQCLLSSGPALSMRAPRSGQNSAPWNTMQRKAKPPSLSEWMHKNGYGMDLVNQVFAGTCAAPTLAKLKKARKDARGPDGHLSRSQRVAILGTDDAAPGGARGGRKAGGKSDAKPRDMERKLKAAEARARAAEQRAKASPAPPIANGDTDAPMAPDDVGAWECDFCRGSHRRHSPACRLCARPRATSGTAAGAAEELRPRSAQQIAADRGRLQQLRGALAADGFGTEEIDKKLKALEREAAGPPQKLPHKRYEEARKAVTRAKELADSLEGKRDSLAQRLDELTTDAACVDRALQKAREQHADATKALEAAASALQPAAAASAPPLALDGVLKSLQAIQDALLKGSLDELIEDAQALYEEYLDGGPPPCGYADFDAWKTQHVAAMIEKEVSRSCRALRGAASSSGVPAAAQADDAYVPTQLGTQEIDASAVDAEVFGVIKGKGKGKSSERYEPS